MGHIEEGGILFLDVGELRVPTSVDPRVSVEIGAKRRWEGLESGVPMWELPLDKRQGAHSKPQEQRRGQKRNSSTSSRREMKGRRKSTTEGASGSQTTSWEMKIGLGGWRQHLSSPCLQSLSVSSMNPRHWWWRKRGWWSSVCWWDSMY